MATVMSAKQIHPMGLVSPVSGVMVSPGRCVNLSNAPPTLECRIRQHLDRAMRQAKFTHYASLCENVLFETLMNARQYRAQPHHSYQGKKVTRLSFGTARSNDRDQEQIRMHLLGMIWYVWSRGTRQKSSPGTRTSFSVRALRSSTRKRSKLRSGIVWPSTPRRAYRSSLRARSRSS